MRKLISVSLISGLLILAGCSKPADNPRDRINLNGTGVVNYKVVNAETGDEKVLNVQMLKVRSISFHETYIVVEYTDENVNRATLVPISQIVSFEWKQQ